MRFINRLAVLAALLLGSSNAYASSAAPGYISQIFSMRNGVLMFSSSGTRSAAPGCQGAAVPRRWAINASTPSGQAQAAALLTAYSLRKQIQIEGANSCDDWGDTETVNYFFTVGDG